MGWSDSGLTGKGLLDLWIGCKECGTQLNAGEAKSQPYCWECGACPNCVVLIDLYSTGKHYDRHICKPCSQTPVGKVIMTYPNYL